MRIRFAAALAPLVALPALVAAQSTVRSAQSAVVSGARNPAYAPDGRLAVSVRGDLWIVSPEGRWTRVTSGAEWDREPAWASDSKSLVYSSNKSGNFDLWQVAVGPNGAAGAPARLAGTAEPDGEPAVARGGRILFVRGRGSAARIYVREPDGSERRLTSGRVAERSPAVSPDGGRVVFVALSEAGRRLVLRPIGAAPATDSSRAGRGGGRGGAGGASGGDSTIATTPGLEHPAWSPNGDRVTFTVGGARPGVFVAPTDGRYVNLVSPRHAESAWSPDGKRLTLVDLPDEEVGYNGDPDRLGDRDADNLLAREGQLWTVTAPPAPESGASAATQSGAPLLGVDDRRRYNAAALDEVTQRIARLYYSGPAGAERRTQWESLSAKYRPRVIAAASDQELRAALHELLRQHPSYRASATGRAAVSSAHPVATAAGLEILAKGGNVVDAAAAVSFALGVVEPDASGLGGYGQMLVYRNEMTAPALIEFMSRVPEDAALSNADILQAGRLPDDGPVLANVPGTAAAMHLAWKKYGSGKVAWADVLAPAIRAARDGYVVSDGLATTLATEREHFLKYEGSRALFFRNGAPVTAGDTVRNPDLAWTLEQIARGGADAFYRGEVARRIVADLRSRGNAMKLTDLSRYYAAEREPVSGTYRGFTLYSSAPPVAGGAQLVGTLNLLEHYKDPKPYTEDAATLHAMLSAWLLVPSSRNRIADPGLWPVTVEPITNKDTADARWHCFDPAKAIGPEVSRGDSLSCAERSAARPDARLEVAMRSDVDSLITSTAAEQEEPSTTHVHSSGTTAFTVADADGNVVAVTQTLGTWGGNFYVSPGLGFLYNDKLGSYGTDPGSYGARLPYARHGSTLAPTIAFERAGNAKPRPIAAVGAAGNAWITSAVYQMLVGILDQRLDPQAALELPRFLLGFRGGGDRGISVQMEDGFSPDVLRRLEELGYRPQLVSLPGELREGYGAAVTIRQGKVTAGADPRRSGAAGAVP
jgi:gamma-glutamyltranspeptidase